MTDDPGATRAVVPTELARWVDAEVHLPSALVVDPAPIVVDITQDSRRVEPGSLFVCIFGSHVDGHELAADAVARGAVALLVERPLHVGVPQIVVPDTRRAVGPLAAGFFGEPAQAMKVIGITGTNGKTTVTHMLRGIGEAAGTATAAIGTLTGGHSTPTTPEAIDLHRHLALLRDQGTGLVALEVSSHALALHRVDGLVVDVAVFTNLSRDHLDFHGTMDAYFQAKAVLFAPERARQAVVNLDDPYGRLLSDAAQIPTTGYSLADAGEMELHSDHSRFWWRDRPVRLPLVGEVNVANALAAATAAEAVGIERDAIVGGLESLGPVSGRFEVVDIDADFTVMVDYAHTPDALSHLLEAARGVCPSGRIHLVFGCGGDKDRTKRAPMGEVASRLADRLVLTSDNPRSEEPAAIISEIRAGVESGVEVEIEVDRRRAIALALATAEAGDLVIIAGKGHEETQTIGDRVIPFRDAQVVVEEYGRLAEAQPS